MLLNLLMNTNELLKALDIFWKGMLAIAIVICLIILVTMLMNKCSDNSKAKQTKKEDQGSETQNQ